MGTNEHTRRTTQESMVPLSKVKDVHQTISEDAQENSTYHEYAVGVSFAADELLELIQEYEEDNNQ